MPHHSTIFNQHHYCHILTSPAQLVCIWFFLPTSPNILYSHQIDCNELKETNQYKCAGIPIQSDGQLASQTAKQPSNPLTNNSTGPNANIDTLDTVLSSSSALVTNKTTYIICDLSRQALTLCPTPAFALKERQRRLMGKGGHEKDCKLVRYRATRSHCLLQARLLSTLRCEMKMK